MPYVYAQLRICVAIFSNNSIIPTGFKFTGLHALTLAARSYALLATVILSFLDFLTFFVCRYGFQAEPIARWVADRAGIQVRLYQ